MDACDAGEGEARERPGKVARAAGFEPAISGLEPDALARLSYAPVVSTIGTCARFRSAFSGATTRRSSIELRRHKWSQVRVTIPAVDPYERSLLASEALRDETWKRV